MPAGDLIRIRRTDAYRVEIRHPGTSTWNHVHPPEWETLPDLAAIRVYRDGVATAYPDADLRIVRGGTAQITKVDTGRATAGTLALDETVIPDEVPEDPEEYAEVAEHFRGEYGAVRFDTGPLGTSMIGHIGDVAVTLWHPDYNANGPDEWVITRDEPDGETIHVYTPADAGPAEVVTAMRRAAAEDHARTIETLIVGFFDGRMSADDLADQIGAEVLPALDRDGEPIAIVDAVTFADALVLTRDHGAVLTLSDGSEFQIAIAQTRPPRDG